MLEDVLKSDIIENTMVSLLLYSIEKENRVFEGGRNHFYEIRFSSAKENECWIGDTEEVYTKRSAERVFKIMRQELIDVRDQKENQAYLTNRLIPLLRRK